MTDCNIILGKVVLPSARRNSNNNPAIGIGSNSSGNPTGGTSPERGNRGAHSSSQGSSAVASPTATSAAAVMSQTHSRMNSIQLSPNNSNNHTPASVGEYVPGGGTRELPVGVKLLSFQVAPSLRAVPYSSDTHYSTPLPRSATEQALFNLLSGPAASQPQLLSQMQTLLEKAKENKEKIRAGFLDIIIQACGSSTAVAPESGRLPFGAEVSKVASISLETTLALLQEAFQYPYLTFAYCGPVRMAVLLDAAQEEEAGFMKGAGSSNAVAVGGSQSATPNTSIGGLGGTSSQPNSRNSRHQAAATNSPQAERSTKVIRFLLSMCSRVGATFDGNLTLGEKFDPNTGCPVRTAVLVNNMKALTVLLDHPRINPNRGSGLFYAIHACNVDAVRLLLHHPKTFVNKMTGGGNGSTPLGEAILRGNEEIFCMMLTHPRIDINRGFTMTPLQLCAMKGRVHFCRLLLSRPNVAVNKCLGVEKSPLELAIENEHDDVFQLLLGDCRTYVPRALIDKLEHENDIPTLQHLCDATEFKMGAVWNRRCLLSMAIVIALAMCALLDLRFVFVANANELMSGAILLLMIHIVSGIFVTLILFRRLVVASPVYRALSLIPFFCIYELALNFRMFGTIVSAKPDLMLRERCYVSLQTAAWYRLISLSIPGLAIQVYALVPFLWTGGGGSGYLMLVNTAIVCCILHVAFIVVAVLMKKDVLVPHSRWMGAEGHAGQGAAGGGGAESSTAGLEMVDYNASSGAGTGTGGQHLAAGGGGGSVSIHMPADTAHHRRQHGVPPAPNQQPQRQNTSNDSFDDDMYPLDGGAGATTTHNSNSYTSIVSNSSLNNNVNNSATSSQNNSIAIGRSAPRNRNLSSASNPQSM